MSVCVCVCQGLCQCQCLGVCVSVCVCQCLSVCGSVSMSMYVSVSVSVSVSYLPAICTLPAAVAMSLAPSHHTRKSFSALTVYSLSTAAVMQLPNYRSCITINALSVLEYASVSQVGRYNV